MHRITTSTAAPDLHGTGKAGFTDGDPATGVPSTRLNGAWFNAVQEELARVVEEAGITLDPGDHGQLLEAITLLIAGSAFSGAWDDIAGKPAFATVASTGAYGDLIDAPDALTAGDFVIYTHPTTPAFFPRQYLMSLLGIALPGFGTTSGYGSYGVGLDQVTHPGVHWVYGAGGTNPAPHGGGNGGWLWAIPCGCDFGDNALYINIGRQPAGGDYKTIYMQQMVGGVKSAWYKVNAGNCDTVGGLSASQLRIVRQLVVATLQAVVSATLSASWVAVPGFSRTITTTGGAVLITVSVVSASDNDNARAFRITRDGVVVGAVGEAGGLLQAHAVSANPNNANADLDSVTFSVSDVPAAGTYSYAVEWAAIGTSGAVHYINRTVNLSSGSAGATATSTMTLTEYT